jgi:hypothetical protein
MFAKAVSSLNRAVERSDWAGFAVRSAVKSADASQGFYESSFDLRTGLEVIEEPLQSLPADLASEFRRQQAA